jgi:ABC-type amino acid transport substrate-binding protein
VKLKIIRTAKHFDSVVDQVERREADIALAALFPTLERAKTVLFTHEYCMIKPLLVIHRAKSRFYGNDMKVLSMAKSGIVQGKPITLGVYGTGNIAQKAKHRFPKVVLKIYKERETLIQALLSGEISAVYIDELEALKWRAQVTHFDLYLRMIADSEASLPISIAVHSKDTQLQYWLNLLISQLKMEGELEKRIASGLSEL